VAITQAILGIQPDWEGLKIDPCIPAEWEFYRVRRVFRGTVYDIEVQNPQHVCQGVVSIQIDGQEIEGNLLPVFKVGDSRHVVVRLGKIN
jgi:cellobiose phosphorylase